MKRYNSTICLLLLFCAISFAQEVKPKAHQFDPPWQPTDLAGTHFTIYGIDNMPDFHGDINNPDLVIFFAGNQYMVVPELLEAFKNEHPEYSKVFAETIPPGIEAKQIASGGLIVGNLRITLQPDIVTAGKQAITLKATQGWFTDTCSYAKNKLALMVYKGNPKHIASLKDLSKDTIKIAMPNPEWEGIAKRIIKAYQNAGGDELATAVMKTKLKEGTTLLTTIHHRETPLMIMNGMADVGPVWFSEAYYHSMLTNHPISMITIPDNENVYTTYAAGLMKKTTHKEAAKAFMQFLVSKKAQDIYRKYGFKTIH
ncbi:molybdate ABC transporter substrate-binding protein [Zhouia sp. PK063]|uniref:molybdate ABC transporter substrate-binding protein n=1 Tax=Zhouia sp. PK063 TaxID=3373602 RepID=UPI0037AD31F8